MASKRNRALDSLGDPVYAELAFQAIENAFHPVWLETAGDHPVKKLWNRPDRLATVELFVFGAAIEKLQKSRPEWLKMTLKKVREVKPCIGFITEIIACAQLSAVKGNLEPAGKNQKGYDLLATYEHGTKHFISVKNHDVSDVQKKFNQHSRSVRHLWRQKLKLEKANLALSVIGNRPLEEQDFEDLKAFISGRIDLSKRNAIVNANMKIVLRPLERPSGSLSPNHTSDTFMVVAPGPDTEQTRFRRSILAAASNMKKNIAPNPGSRNLVFMRVHVNADLNYLETVARNLLSEESAGIDGILFYQPSYGRDTQDRSLLLNTFKPVFGLQFVQSLDGRLAYSISPALGAVSMEPSRLVVNTDGQQSDGLPPNTFVFQAGDIYIVSNQAHEGHLNAPAMGIHEHSVIRFQDRELTISGKIFPESDDLLIV